MSGAATIEFRCPQCSKLLRCGASYAGQLAKCPQCGHVMDIPPKVPDRQRLQARERCRTRKPRTRRRRRARGLSSSTLPASEDFLAWNRYSGDRSSAGASPQSPNAGPPSPAWREPAPALRLLELLRPGVSQDRRPSAPAYGQALASSPHRPTGRRAILRHTTPAAVRIRAGDGNHPDLIPAPAGMAPGQGMAPGFFAGGQSFPGGQGYPSASARRQPPVPILGALAVVDITFQRRHRPPNAVAFVVRTDHGQVRHVFVGQEERPGTLVRCFAATC